MVDSNSVVDTRIKAFSSTDEDEIYESMIGSFVDGTIDSGGRFWGTLEAVTEQKLLIRGEHGQRILIKRRKISRLVVSAPNQAVKTWEDEQTAADVKHLEAWVEGEKKAGRTPTDDDIVAEMERHVCCEDTLLTFDQAEAAARARKGGR